MEEEEKCKLGVAKFYEERCKNCEIFEGCTSQVVVLCMLSYNLELLRREIELLHSDLKERDKL